MSQPERAKTVGSRSAPATLRWSIGFSLTLHAVAVLVLLLVPHTLLPEIEAPSIELVMLPAEPNSQPAAPPVPSTVPPAQETPPQPETPSQPETAPQPNTAPQPDAAPEHPLPQEPPPPQQQEPVPTPPPPTIPEPPLPPPPRPRPPSEPHTSARTPPSRAKPQTTETPHLTAPPADASASPPSAPTAQRETPALANPAWLSGVSAWLLAHRSYPEMARRLGRQGTVVVKITVDPEGHVLDVTLVQGSGSESLDQAAQALVRNAHLPPFPPDMKVPRQSVTLPIRYRLE